MKPIVYVLYKPIRFYHFSNLCPIFKSLIKMNENKDNIEHYEIEVFENPIDAIKHGYLHPCPFCSEYKTKIITLKINECFYQYVLNEFEIVLLLYFYKIAQKNNGAIKLKNKEEYKIYIFLWKMIKNFAKLNLLEKKDKNLYYFSINGLSVISYILNVLKFNYINFNFDIEKIIENIKIKVTPKFKNDLEAFLNNLKWQED